ncbi:uncharacterized protein K452DRAFT_362644 [Aplosporella prunicola CBS 121167]|uniref:Uncharacterized protein n=1 Tax=Aplosporella prunicola CBS 121167 TaxID=1176127 RepID=A0A6A6AZQ0_9PEZI|nr:uncharacterized protein K452DRAFT_362644 [Aplosporella prunicola CBS 121167]KAF2136247.1 hypothetical protein K452DRAFT_362644 [Aplosporella prunicola CBS 121167]
MTRDDEAPHVSHWAPHNLPRPQPGLKEQKLHYEAKLHDRNEEIKNFKKEVKDLLRDKKDLNKVVRDLSKDKKDLRSDLAKQEGKAKHFKQMYSGLSDQFNWSQQPAQLGPAVAQPASVTVAYGQQYGAPAPFAPAPFGQQQGAYGQQLGVYGQPLARDDCRQARSCSPSRRQNDHYRERSRSRDRYRDRSRSPDRRRYRR